MDTLIKWAIYGAIAVGVLGAVYGAWHHFIIAPAEARGAAVQKAADDPQIAHWKSEAELAQADNKRLSGDVADLQGRYNALFAEGKNRQAASDAQVAAAKANAAKSDAALAEVQALLKRAPSTEPCTGICANADSILRDAITEDAAP